MPYKLSIEREDEYIRVDLYGRLTQPDIDSAMKEVLMVCQKQKLHRILCDQRQLQVPPNDTVGFLTAVQFSKGPYAGMKLAIIRRQVEEERLFEIAAHNRGVIVRVFEGEEEAKQWLHAK
jgi:hypothetical protein